MRGAYYYLVSSLPYLKFGQAPPVPSADFLSECQKWLTPEDMKAIISARVDVKDIKEEDTDVLRKWKAFDRALREGISAERAGEKPAGDKMPDVAKQIMDEENALLKEKAFERARWDFLDQMQTRHFFDVDWLALYFLKLQILERLAMFDKDKGEKVFYDACEVTI